MATRRRTPIPKPTERRVLAASGNRCALCKGLLSEHIGTEAFIGEVAHIVADSDRGPRGAAEVPPGERAAYENLIVLCPSCHTAVDTDRTAWPPERLRAAKSAHEEWVKRIGDVGAEVVAAEIAADRDRPRFSLVVGGRSTSEHAFGLDSWRIKPLSGDVVRAIDWRARVGDKVTDWRHVDYSMLDRAHVTTERFDLTNSESPAALELEIRFNWRGRWRREIHRWPLTRRPLPHKTLWDMHDEQVEVIELDEQSAAARADRS